MYDYVRTGIIGSTIQFIFWQSIILVSTIISSHIARLLHHSINNAYLEDTMAVFFVIAIFSKLIRNRNRYSICRWILIDTVILLICFIIFIIKKTVSVWYEDFRYSRRLKHFALRRGGNNHMNSFGSNIYTQ